MRNISFALTESQFLDGSKDVTRRLGWSNLKEGDFLMACRKCMGLQKGESPVELGIIEVRDVRREPLGKLSEYPAYGRDECRREGFPDMSGTEFVAMFCKHMGCKPSDEITRIQFGHVLDKARFLSTSEAFFCGGCQAIDVLELPMTIPQFTKRTRQFRLSHLACGRVERPVPRG